MKTLTTLTIALLVNIVGLAQTNDSILYPRLKLDITAFDMPYQFEAAKTVGDGDANFGSYLGGYANPSMKQSLSITSSMYTASHFYISKLFKTNKILNGLTLFTADMILTYAPGGDGWIHEEYHRSVMTKNGVQSFNDMNTFPLFSETVSVNDVKDLDLVRFKADKPKEFIRMHVAGIEGEYMLIDNLQKQNFFYNHALQNQYLYIFATLNSILYVNTSSDPEEADKLTDEMNIKEREMDSRDFTGLDFSAWAYDLFHSDEPYENRGVHPSGNGIDRYIKTTDLEKDALEYLEKQGKLQWLNVLSPMIISNRTFRYDKNTRINFSVRNMLTSFGNDISINLLISRSEKNMVLKFHNANNYTAWFPSIEFELYEYPFRSHKNQFLVSSRVLIGTQPKDQSFKTKNHQLLGFIESRVDWLTKSRITPWIEISAKTEGWIAGNEYLDQNIAFRFGLSARIK